MRKLLAKIIQILDGTPAEYGKRQTGQALVETAAVVPLLLILLSGMVEIGWFANNYLTLLDVTRAGARRGATLSVSDSPLAWDNRASYLPFEMLRPEYVAEYVGYMPYSGDPNGDQSVPANQIAQRELYQRSRYHPTDHISGLPEGANWDGCLEPFRDFYNDIACTMEDTLEPLILSYTNGVDDIIVSAFAIEAIRPEHFSSVGSEPRMVVVGRYPTNANECDAVETGPSSGDFTASSETRDPFDVNGNGLTDFYTPSDEAYTVVYPFVWNEHFSELYPGIDDNQEEIILAEKQVGYSFTGQQRAVITRADGSQLQTLCLGSSWTISDVEELINLEGYIPTADERELMEGTGLVLAEIFWRHEMLLKLPVFNPVYGMFSPDGEPPTIYVWAAFPLPSVTPNIRFHN